MKKILYGFIALSAIFAGLTSCDDTNIDFPGDVDQNVGPVNIVVSSKSDDTRIYFQHDNDVLKSFWEDGDKVLAISQSGTVYELQVGDIEGNYARITGMAERGTTVKLVYQKGITRDKWVRDNGLKVDFSNQQIRKLDSDNVKPGQYQIAPVVMAGNVDINDQGNGKGDLDFLCGIVKVTAVQGVPVNQIITKFALKGRGLSGGTYSYNKSLKDIVYTPSSDDYDELVVNVTADDNLTYTPDAKTLSKEVFFAVPAQANLKQATVTTTNSFYFRNIDATKNSTTGQITQLGRDIAAKDYYNIKEFEEYYFTVDNIYQFEEGYVNGSNPRKIQFAPGNLFASGIKWDTAGHVTNASEVGFYFEKNQWDFRQISGATNDNAMIESLLLTETPEGTCGSFMWSEYSNGSLIVNGNNSYCKSNILVDGENPYLPSNTTDQFFTQDANFNSLLLSHRPEYETEYKWYTLTTNEWDYLVKHRLLPEDTFTSGNNHLYTYSTTINVGNSEVVTGLIIFHDNYVGPKTNLTYIPDGCAFLPVTGCREGLTVSAKEAQYDGSYWTASLASKYSAAMFVFYPQGANGVSVYEINKNNGRAIRLVRNLPTDDNPSAE